MDISPKRKRIILALVGAGLLTAGSVGGAAALSGGDDDGSERPIPAGMLEQAERAALAETGGGRVTETEVDDEESTYEVEVTLGDGSQVDVQLDESFQVVGTESDGASEADDSEDGGAD